MTCVHKIKVYFYCRIEEGMTYSKINYCLPFSWLLPSVAKYLSTGELLPMKQLEAKTQKVKHLWQLKSNVRFDPKVSSKL